MAEASDSKQAFREWSFELNSVKVAALLALYQFHVSTTAASFFLSEKAYNEENESNQSLLQSKNPF